MTPQEEQACQNILTTLQNLMETLTVQNKQILRLKDLCKGLDEALDRSNKQRDEAIELCKTQSNLMVMAQTQLADSNARVRELQAHAHES